MSGPFITCHVLDTSVGKPAAGVVVQLQLEDDQDVGKFQVIATSKTDADGRCKDLHIAPEIGRSRTGTYKLIFSVKQYFQSCKKQSFWPRVEVIFEVAEDEHYHVPLLISPFSYTVYRGS